MTAKRFEICDVDLYEYGMPLNEIMDNGVPLSQNQVCELLNELHEENQILRHELLCKQLDKAPTEPINCKCHYEVKE